MKFKRQIQRVNSVKIDINFLLKVKIFTWGLTY